MALRHGDLKDTVIKNISIDEFEPKTGDLKDVGVMGFYVTERTVAADLYDFVQQGFVPVRDVEITPNPTEDGYYMVFVELDRDANLMDNMRTIVGDVENVAGKLPWQYKTHIMDSYKPWAELDGIMSDPNTFMTVEQYVAEQERLEQERLEEERWATHNEIMEFMSSSGLRELTFEDGCLNMLGNTDSAEFEFVAIGNPQETMESLGLSSSALQEMDVQMRRFQEMIHPMRVVKIEENFIIYNPHNSEKVLVARPR